MNAQPMLEPRAWCSLSYVNGNLYAVGGRRNCNNDDHTNARMEWCRLGNGAGWGTMDERVRRAHHSCSIVNEHQ